MTANVDAMVRAGVEAYRAGNKAEARTLLERALELDQYNETAWLWLSAVVDTREEQQTCLENVIVINPENQRAQQGLRSLGIDPQSVLDRLEEEEPIADEDGYYDDAGAAFVNDDSLFEDPNATINLDDDYSVPSSSASANFEGDELSSSQYDDWVQGLNLGSDDAGDASQAQEEVFGGSGFDDSGYGFDDDELFGNEGDYGASDSFDESFDSSYDSYDDVQLQDDVFGDAYTDDFQEFMQDDSAQSDDYMANSGELSDFESALDNSMFDDDYGDDDFGADDPFEDVQDEPEPDIDDYFRMLPPEIEPTRLPTEDEPIPGSARLITNTLIVLNVIALVGVLVRFII